MNRRDIARAKLDALLDYHESHGTDTTGPLHVALSPTELGKILGQVPRKGSSEFDYRGRVVIATASDPVAARFRGGFE